MRLYPERKPFWKLQGGLGPGCWLSKVFISSTPLPELTNELYNFDLHRTSGFCYPHW